MAYNYQKERPSVFTPEGQKKVLLARDRAKNLIALSGAVRADKLMEGFIGDSWESLAVIDYLVELNEIAEVSRDEIPMQFRVFTLYR